MLKIAQPIIALDFANRQLATDFLAKFPNEQQLFVKVGMELFYSEGQELVKEIKEAGHQVFLDLKCHDIPNTVYSAMRVLGKLGVDLTTVHAAGGKEMMQAAKEGLLDGSGGKNLAKIIAITQLTSTSPEMVKTEQLIGVDLKESVRNYAKLAQSAGLDGIVCSAHEANDILQATAPDFLRVTPGIRLAGGDIGDQKRVMTPDQAAKNNASAIVVGRAITQATDPVATYNLVKQLWEEK